jgi:hypothetical protein
MKYLLLVATAGLSIGRTSSQSTCSISSNPQFESSVSSLLGPFTVGESFADTRGISWIDYNNDGNLDLIVPNSDVAGLFRNNGDGTFTNVADAAGITTMFTDQALVGDLDNDGYQDIIFFPANDAAARPPDDTTVIATDITVYKNNGDGTFTDITETAGIPGNAYTRGASIADYDLDGYLDIFIGGLGRQFFGEADGQKLIAPNKLYRNNGDMTFTDVSVVAGIEGFFTGVDGEPAHGQSCISTWHDYNGDRYPDLIVGHCLSEAAPGFQFFKNNGDGTFEDVTVAVGWDVPGVWMGLTVGDFDGDGDLDFYAGGTGRINFVPLPSNPDGVFPHVLMVNNGDGTYSPDFETIPNHEFNWGSTFVDVDNGGDLDLVTVGSLPEAGVLSAAGLANPGRLFVNDGSGNFDGSECLSDLNLENSYTTGVAQGDFDGDGYQDLVVQVSSFVVGSPVPENDKTIRHVVLLRNTNSGSNYLTTKLVGTSSNRDGIGAVVKVGSQIREVRSGSSFSSSEQLWPHFGLGSEEAGPVDVMVQWPSGMDETWMGIEINQVVMLEEGTSPPSTSAPTKAPKSTQPDDTELPTSAPTDASDAPICFGRTAASSFFFFATSTSMVALLW